MFHQAHHADKDMDASTALRFHPIEIAYSGLIRISIIPLIGIQLEHLLAYELVMLPIILFHHSNIKLNEFIDKRRFEACLLGWLLPLCCRLGMLLLHRGKLLLKLFDPCGKAFGCFCQKHDALN